MLSVPLFGGMLGRYSCDAQKRPKKVKMRHFFARQPLFLGCLACGLCLPAQRAGAGAAITAVEIDGQTVPLPTEGSLTGHNPVPVRISSTAGSIRVHFANDAEAGGAVRLRYRLDGVDGAWRDLPAKMRMMVQFCGPNRDVVGSQEYYMEGETPGWRGAAEYSDFTGRREHAVAPERSLVARIACLSHGGEAAVGVIGIDAVRLLVERPGTKEPKIYDFDVTKGIDLGHPLGSAAKWMREGSRAELAQLRTRAAPKPHPILVIVDDDPRHFGNWSTAWGSEVPVRPGDRLTIEWQTAHSVGGSGPGMAEYHRLKPGTYWFRVAAVKANGDPTGIEVSLPIEVVAPLYLRIEFWVAIGAACLAGVAWMGRWALQRRMQRRIAEIEHERALERERARIARDLHDEIGAGLTEIAMQSDWVCREVAQTATADTQRRIEGICRSAVELVRNVDEIVWAVNPANDTVDRFVNYLAQHTEHFLEASGLRVRFDIPQELPASALPGAVRHFLFLAVREALSNAVKHARADLVRLEILNVEGWLQIAVEDNGCGFVPEEVAWEGTRDGLENMRQRMNEIGGRFSLLSQPGGGTRVEFSVALANEPPKDEP